MDDPGGPTNAHDRARQDIQAQLDAMAAAGLGDTSATGPVAGVVTVPVPVSREPFRLAGAIGFAALAVVLAVSAARYPQPAADAVAGQVDVALSNGFKVDFLWAAATIAAVSAGVWLAAWARPKPRHYTRAGVIKAAVAGVLIVPCSVLWFQAFDATVLDPYWLLVVPLLSMLEDTIVRWTGPPRSQNLPRSAARSRMLRTLTPFPVMVTLAVAWCGYQALAIGR